MRVTPAKIGDTPVSLAACFIVSDLRPEIPISSSGREIAKPKAESNVTPLYMLPEKAAIKPSEMSSGTAQAGTPKP